ncbi:hypothetical protein [Methylocystis parvus]|uniref:hypothetical protein n=1 Tax=Methylocystis parvus TaxID=134 RepID=UPI003C761D6E
MTYININAKPAQRRGFRTPDARCQAIETPGVMPAHIFLRLFLSAFAAILLVHFWKHGGR